jgi:PAS domain S-box-containing protein
MKAPLPAGESERLEALRRYGVLDTPSEEAFDDLTLLAAHICQVPCAMVSLVDEHRQWFKSRIGVTAAETPRDIAFCAHTILHADQVFEVRDAQADARFADNPLVTGESQLRFYAGAPLVAPDGHVLGALCVTDTVPRKLDREQLDALRALSRHVVSQLELRRQSQQLAKEIADRRQAEATLQQQYDTLAASERKTASLLALAEKSRRALLSILEDEKLAGENLRTSEERFRQLADNIQEMFWLTQPSTNQVLYVSPAYEKIWGRTCASLYAEPEQWLNAIHPEDRDRVLHAWVEDQNGEGFDEEFRIVRPDGSIRWIHDRGSPVRDAAGSIIRIAGVAEDITNHRRLEEQFHQAQKMDAMGALAGGIAHDFNNILAVIGGYVELLRLLPPGSPDAAEYLDSIWLATKRATNLVSQILTFSRHEETLRVPTQLAPVVEEAMKFLRSTIPTSIEINVALAPEAPVVIADANQFHQIVMNLGTNASHAMRDGGGTLDVRLDGFLVDSALAESNTALRPGNYARLSVSDTGKGMDATTLRRIFEPFFTTKPQGEGTGLGLAVVHGIMKSHGGAVTVYSQPGQGTVFTLYFPADAGAPPVAETGETAIPSGKGERILYVDDEMPLARLGQKILEGFGYVVEPYTNVSAALALVRAEPRRFDLVVTDQTMPGMNGTDFARELAQICPAVPVILTTGYIGEMTLEHLRTMGIRELLLKPPTIQSLGKLVHRLLHERNTK